MSSDLGTAPYDAIPFIAADRLKIPFRIFRMCYDIIFATCGFLLGSTIGAVTVIMAFALGPVISWVKDNIIEKILLR